MPTPVKFRGDGTIQRVAISSGGANEITFVEFPGLPANAIINVSVTVEMRRTNRGDEGDAIDDEFAFPVFANGINSYDEDGWGREGGTPRMRLASPDVGAFARFLLQAK